jgi:hypothetical protein
VLGAAEMCCERSVALEGGLGDVFCEFLCFLLFLFYLISFGFGKVGRERERESVGWIDGWG